MEIDSGYSSLLISKKDFYELLNARLSKRGIIQRLRTYSDAVIIPKGVANLNVKYKGKMYNIMVLVVPGWGPNLLGRD